MNNPFISVVIPSFNHDKFIKRAITSVLNQTYTNWELIIVDNNSTDNTDQILQNFHQKNISIIKIQNEGIIALSRNIGIKSAKGDWIAFLDSDDEWFENKLQIIIDNIDQNTDVLYHDLRIKKNNLSFFNKKVIKGRDYKKPVLQSILINGSKINNSSVVVRKILLEKIGYISTDKKLIASEDFNTWLKIANISNGFKYIPMVLGLYTIHDSGISRKDMSFSMKQASIEFVKTLNQNERKKLYSHIRYSHCRYIFTNSIKTNINKQLMFCIKHGNLNIKLKSFYMIAVLNFKINI
jgi:glycosyltransferase involved in cell wall biosynthesis